jgi:SAM-dependent methyltransferase
MDAGQGFPGSWGYGELASLAYQLDKPVGTSFGDVEFYLELLSGVTGEVLEPTVGTGRVLIPLLQHGLRVRGYDASAAMLSVCRANCEARGLDPVLSEADMVAFSDPGAFQAVVIPAGSFALVIGRDRAAAALRNARQSLAAAGRLIVDVEPPQFTPGPFPLRYWWHGDELLTLTGHCEADAAAQRITCWNRYELWRDAGLIRTELQPFTLQWYGLEEFAAMLRDAGFPQVTVHGDYHAGQQPVRESRVWTFEATRD